MKTVAFVCLLSLSLCLSQPTTQPADHATQQQTSPTPVKTDLKSSPPAKTEQKSLNSTLYNATETVIVTSTEAAPSPHPTQAANAPTITTQTKAATDTKAQDNKVAPEKKEEAPKSNEGKTTEPPKNDAKSVVKDPAEGAAPADKEKKGETSTEQAVTAKVPEAPKDATEKPTVQARGFDGPSFIGGIILTLGLLAIGFMGYKYHKNQTERNYHTL